MAAHQALPSLGFSRQEYWSGVPLSSPSSILHQNKFQIQVSLLFKSILYVTLLFLKTYISTWFANWKKSKEGFHFCNNNNKKEWKVKIVSRVCFAGSLYALGPEWHHQALYQETRLGASTSRHHNFELCQWASVIYLDLFCTSISKICPKNCSLHYAILAYERLQRNALPLDSGGNL